MVSNRTSTSFQYTGNSLTTTGEWFSFWALSQRRRMKEDFLREGANLALRFKLAAILNDATQVGKIGKQASLQMVYEMLTCYFSNALPRIIISRYLRIPWQWTSWPRFHGETRKPRSLFIAMFKVWWRVVISLYDRIQGDWKLLWRRTTCIFRVRHTLLRNLHEKDGPF